MKNPVVHPGLNPHAVIDAVEGMRNPGISRVSDRVIGPGESLGISRPSKGRVVPAGAMGVRLGSWHEGGASCADVESRLEIKGMVGTI